MVENTEMVPVESSNIMALGYDKDEKVLYAEFKHGGTYAYTGVPEYIYTNLLDAESVGKWFHTAVKQAGFPYAKVRK